MNAFCMSTTLPMVGNTRCELSSSSRQSRRGRIRCASGAAVRLRQRTATALRDRIDELATLKEWLLLDKFDRRQVNAACASTQPVMTNGGGSEITATLNH